MWGLLSMCFAQRGLSYLQCLFCSSLWLLNIHLRSTWTSLAAICHGRSGIWWEIMDSFGLYFRCSKHVVHLSTISSICLFMPGQNKVSLALCLLFSIPMCAVWMRSNISALSTCGMMIFSPLNRSPSISEISSLWFQYPARLEGHFFLTSGHPAFMTLLREVSCGSCSVAFRLLVIFPSLTGRLATTVWICASISSSSDSSLYKMDSWTAHSTIEMSFPGRCTISILYLCSCKIILKAWRSGCKRLSQDGFQRLEIRLDNNLSAIDVRENVCIQTPQHTIPFQTVRNFLSL